MHGLFVVNGAVVRVPALSCRACFSENIRRYFDLCITCYNILFFDEIRFEIVCPHCGLVHAGIDPNTIYPWGFLLKRP